MPLDFVVAVIRDSQMREIATMRARVVELESEADRLRRQLTNEKFERSVKVDVATRMLIGCCKCACLN